MLPAIRIDSKMHYSSALFLAVGAGKVLAQAGGCSPLHFIYGTLLAFIKSEQFV